MFACCLVSFSLFPPLLPSKHPSTWAHCGSHLKLRRTELIHTHCLATLITNSIRTCVDTSFLTRSWISVLPEHLPRAITPCHCRSSYQTYRLHPSSGTHHPGTPSDKHAAFSFKPERIPHLTWKSHFCPLNDLAAWCTELKSSQAHLLYLSLAFPLAHSHHQYLFHLKQGPTVLHVVESGQSAATLFFFARNTSAHRKTACPGWHCHNATMKLSRRE